MKSLGGWVAAAGCVMVLVACGGGGAQAEGDAVVPTVEVRGVVARGGALVEAKVTARCTAGPVVTAVSGSSGAYAMALGEDVFPCVLEAVSADGAWRLHSVLPPQTRTAHITPLTELLVAELAGATPASFMAKAQANGRVLGATITPGNLASAQASVGRVLRVMGVDPAPITDALTQPLVAASAVQRGNVHDKVLDALAAAMAGAGADMADLVSLVTGRSRSLELEGLQVH
jgi:hypothetical protein